MLKETSLKKQEIEKTRISPFTMSSEEYFFSEFYYLLEILTENEGNVEVLSILRALPVDQLLLVILASELNPHYSV